MSRSTFSPSQERGVDAVRVGISQALRILRGPMGDEEHDDGPAAIAAKTYGASSRVVSALRRKGAVAPMSTVDNPLAHARVAEGISEDFIDWQRSENILDASSAAMIKPDANTVLRVSAATASGNAVSQSAPKPVQELSFSLAAPPMQKRIALAIVNEEVLRGRNAESIIGRVLRGGISLGSGAGLLSMLQTGVTPVPASGTTAAAFRADLGAALASIRIGAASKIYAAVSPTLMAKLAFLDPAAFPDLGVHGGTAGDVVFVPDDSVEHDSSGSSITIFDASRVAFSDEGVDVRAARAATIQLDSEPTNPPVAATTLHSMWQENRVAILAERYFGVALVSDQAVAVISNANYGG